MDKEENKDALPKNEEEKKNSGENGMRRKHSETSIVSLDVNNEDNDDGDEEGDDEKDVVALGPVVGLKEQLEKDKVLIFFYQNSFLIFFPSSLIGSFENHT